MPSDHIAIRVSHLSKKYKLGGPQEQYSTLRDAIVHSLKAPFKGFQSHPPEEGFWALKDVSFDVERGEVMGIIGRNGSGKSTLLKILSRITTPTEGTIELHGRVGSLLEVGTGFHQEMTGRENIFLNGSILGMKKTEIEQKFDEIVKFAEIDKFIDTPVKRYSSGMYIRLAFAVAAHLEPEVLVVDEVLAVGDIAFQKKCLGKMGEVAKEGRTVLFVSHNMGAIRSLCPSVLLLADGKILESGNGDEVVRKYELLQMTDLNQLSCISVRNPEEIKKSKFFMTRVEIRNGNGENTTVFKYNEKISLIVDFSGDPNGSHFSSEFRIYNELDQMVCVGASGPYHGKFFDETVRKIKIKVGPLILTSGKYRIFLSVMAGSIRTDTWENAIEFTIVECQPFSTHWEIPTFREGACILEQSFNEITD
jgi:lipopolysaccharide transport system ATP-binding protein